ncbi:hypothetical protein F0L17_05450 [Streptomyces sp. TRM43335]|uniref:Uncharacterized protein n=1 Tax=Streptomyces taklimakanensis TaxID=2569853 RepID=A0A6G2B8N1_9ACTN|nr:hypothetical protein [Streptomyces taklimakanensis]
MASLLLTVAACGEAQEKREYAIPSSLCDVDVKPATLSPFLPPGKDITLTEEGTDDFRKTCSVSVNGNVIFEVKREWWEEGWSTRRFATVHAYVKPDHQTPDENYVYSDRSGLGVVRCSPEEDDQDLFIVAKADENTADAEAMRKFLAEYHASLAGHAPCDEVE